MTDSVANDSHFCPSCHLELDKNGKCKCGYLTSLRNYGFEIRRLKDLFILVNLKVDQNWLTFKNLTNQTAKNIAKISGAPLTVVQRSLTELMVADAQETNNKEKPSHEEKTDQEVKENQEEANGDACTYDSETESRIDAEVNRIRESENQLEALTSHLDVMIVGEKNTKQTIVVLLTSGKDPNPANKEIMALKSTSGAGKTNLMERLARGYKVKDVARFSKHALDYSDFEGFEILKLKELGNMDEEKQGLSTIRFLSSDDRGYAVEVTVKDEKTGKFKTQRHRIPPITTISSTTRLALESQLVRRAWLIGLDETQVQTEKIGEWKARLESQNAEKVLGFRKLTNFEFSCEVYKRFVERFQPKNVIIPFPSTLLRLLGNSALRVRGDFNKVLNFVKLYAQFNLKRLRLIKGDVYAVTPEVAVEAVNIVKETLVSMLSNLDNRAEQVFGFMKFLHFDAQDTEFSKETRGIIASAMGKSEKTIRFFFNQLETAGYVRSDDRKPKTFKLLYDVSAIERKLSGVLAKIESADDLISEMEKEAQEWFRSVSENFLPRMGENNSVTEGTMETEDAYTEKKDSSTQEKISNQGLTPFQADSSEKPSEDRQFQKSPELREETKNPSGLVYCPYCRFHGEDVFFATHSDLRSHISAFHEGNV